MSQTQLTYACVLLLSVFVSAVSQVMLKKAAMRTYPSAIREYLNPLVIGAYSIFVVSTLLIVLAYQGIPLSLGPVLEATSYVYVTVFGVVIFHEHVGAPKLVALALILSGIVVFALFG